MAIHDGRSHRQSILLLSLRSALILSLLLMHTAKVDASQAKLGTIYGKVWFDGNRNGSSDPGESIIAGHPVFLASIGEDLPGAGVIMIHTKEDGSFTFADIEIGTYRISIADGTSMEVTLSSERSIAMVDMMFVGWQTFLPFMEG